MLMSLLIIVFCYIAHDRQREPGENRVKHGPCTGADQGVGYAEAAKRRCVSLIKAQIIR